MHMPASVRVYLCTSPCDMRRSFDGLHTLVIDRLQLDAFAGHLFVFAVSIRWTPSLTSHFGVDDLPGSSCGRPPSYEGRVRRV